ncbi:uncharacterized protein LOC108086619 [Drosophila ficusphila]|uniref:uncharacterized protein LOC108086619 n=1 Tax=Drosophila ficusphila TaxID=30025 RepID=UPI0007E85CD8|nr:uncharacterized protein LOC108086619 [Drosophila ficusphila]
MKASFFFCIILVALSFLIASGNNTNKGSQACRQNVLKTCTSSTRSCSRLGKANICQAFKNDCKRQLSNCDNVMIYRKVDAAHCRGFLIEVPRPCRSGKSSKIA